MCKWVKHGDTRIDPCMRKFIEVLVEYFELPIVACCCGHGKYPMTIVSKSKYCDSIHFDLISDTYVPHQKRFYKRDKEGYYYIPEVVKKDKVIEINGNDKIGMSSAALFLHQKINNANNPRNKND